MEQDPAGRGVLFEVGCDLAELDAHSGFLAIVVDRCLPGACGSAVPAGVVAHEDRDNRDLPSADWMHGAAEGGPHGLRLDQPFQGQRVPADEGDDGIRRAVLDPARRVVEVEDAVDHRAARGGRILNHVADGVRAAVKERRDLGHALCCGRRG